MGVGCPYCRVLNPGSNKTPGCVIKIMMLLCYFTSLLQITGPIDNLKLISTQKIGVLLFGYVVVMILNRKTQDHTFWFSVFTSGSLVRTSPTQTEYLRCVAPVHKRKVSWLSKISLSIEAARSILN